MPAGERRAGWEYDDTCSHHISDKNTTHCELTGLYWIWKHCTDDVVGLVHYRRFFQSPTFSTDILSEREISEILSTHDCIMASDFPCCGPDDRELISVAEHYRLLHSSSDLRQVALVLHRWFPTYYQAFIELTVQHHSFAPYNMLICRKPLFDAYAKWLFAVLSHLEKRIDPFAHRDPYQSRIFGFLAERLLNVFMIKNGLSIYSSDIVDPANPSKSLSIPKRLWPLPKAKAPALPTNIPIIDGIDYSSVFNYEFYLNHHSDVVTSYSDHLEASLNHFLTMGVFEGRMAHPHFSIESYMNGNPELRSRYETDRIAYLRHYITNPQDNWHTTGFENLLCEEEKATANPDSVIERLKTARYRYFLQKAERCGVID